MSLCKIFTCAHTCNEIVPARKFQIKGILQRGDKYAIQQNVYNTHVIILHKK